MISRIRAHFTSAHAIALLALFVAVGGSAYAATKIGTNQIRNGAVTSAKIKSGAITSGKLAKGSVTPAKMTEYYNSGMIKLSKGQSKTVVSRGPFRLVAECGDGGAGVVNADLKIKNTGSSDALFESDSLGNYDNPILVPGATKEAFYPISQSIPYWFGDVYNMFSASTYSGNVSLYGGGNMGVNVANADCVYQLFLWGK